MRILLVTTRPPWPIRRGDQARAAGWVEALGDRHEIMLISQRPPGFPTAEAQPKWRRGREVVLSRGRTLASLIWSASYPIQVALHVQPRLRRVVEQAVLEFKPDVAVLTLSRLGWLVPSIKRCPVVLDLVDSLALNMRNRASYQPRLSALWNWEARRLERWDGRLLKQVAYATVVSRRDKLALVPESDASVRIVPFGVRIAEELVLTARPDPIILLSGNLGYFPTHEGAVWFAKEVWGKVRRVLPTARWILAGARPVRAVRRLASLPGVELSDEPQSLSELRREARVAIAPMRSGSGVPIKILEAMADGLPVVATPEAAAGLDGLSGNELSIANGSRSFADALIKLLTSASLVERQAQEAWHWLRERHELRATAQSFEQVLRAAIASGGQD